MPIAFTVERAALHAALRSASRMARGSNANITIARHALLVARDGKVRVSGTNLSTWVESAIAADIETDGALAAPADRLFRLVSGFPDGAEVAIAAQGTSLIVRSGRSKSVIPVLSADEWPSPAPDATARPARMPVGSLRAAITFCRDPIDEGSPRVFLAGLNLKREKRQAWAVSSDGANLAHALLPDLECEHDFDVIVPVPMLEAILDAAPKGAEDAIDLSIGDRLIVAGYGGVTITSRLIDGIWPDWRLMLKAEPEFRVLVETESLSAAIDRISHVTDRSAIFVDGSDGALKLYARGKAETAAGVEASESIAAEIDTPFTTGILPTKMLETLAAIRGEGAPSEIEIRGFLATEEGKAFRISIPGRTDRLRLYMPCVARGPDAP